MSKQISKQMDFEIACNASFSNYFFSLPQSDKLRNMYSFVWNCLFSANNSDFFPRMQFQRLLASLYLLHKGMLIANPVTSWKNQIKSQGKSINNNNKNKQTHDLQWHQVYLGVWENSCLHVTSFEKFIYNSKKVARKVCTFKHFSFWSAAVTGRQWTCQDKPGEGGCLLSVHLLWDIFHTASIM